LREESFIRAGDGVSTRERVLGAAFGARERVDENKMILHGYVDLPLKVSAGGLYPFPKLVRPHERRFSGKVGQSNKTLRLSSDAGLCRMSQAGCGKHNLDENVLAK
jgi:hypothetical protein